MPKFSPSQLVCVWAFSFCNYKKTWHNLLERNKKIVSLCLPNFSRSSLHGWGLSPLILDFLEYWTIFAGWDIWQTTFCKSLIFSVFSHIFKIKNQKQTEIVKTLAIYLKLLEFVLSKPQPNLNTRLGLTIKWLCKPHPTPPPHKRNITLISAVTDPILMKL